MSSNSALVGEAWNAQFPWKWQRNTSISRSIFPLPPSPFIFRPLVPPLPTSPTYARSNVRPVYPPFAPPPPPPSFLSFARRVFICSITGVRCFVREKSSVRWPFSGGNRTVCQCVFYRQSSTRSSVNRLFCDVTCVSVDRKRNLISSRNASLLGVNLYIECN